MPNSYSSRSDSQTQQLAADFVDQLKSGTVITLKGDLGAGKTTFVQGLGYHLGIPRLISPTYVLIRQYPVTSSKHPQLKTLYHIDLYRISTPQEALDLGLTEIFKDPSALTLIEWPELITPYLPKNTTQIEIKKLSQNERQIIINSPSQK